MALNPIIYTPKPAKEGIGGSLGSIIGGAVGAIGGAFAGNPIAGAAAGASLGGMAGGAIDPGKAGEGGDNIPLSNVPKADQTVPLDRFKNDPEVQLAQLQTAKEALRGEQSISATDAQKIHERLSLAQDMITKRLNA